MFVAWQGIEVEAPWADQVWRLTSQWNGRLRAAHSGAVHRRVRRQRAWLCARGGLRMELRSAESPQGRANIPREFCRPDITSSSGGSAIQLFRSALVGERAGPQPTTLARLSPGSGTIPTEVSVEARPREFYRRESLAADESVVIQGFNSVAVSGRAGSGGRKSLRSTPTPNQPMERTPPRYALPRRSSPC